MSTPGAGTESPDFLPSKTAVFSSKPAGEDMASPLHHRGGKLFDKPEFRAKGVVIFWKIYYNLMDKNFRAKIVYDPGREGTECILKKSN